MRAATYAPATTIHVASRAYATSGPYPTITHAQPPLPLPPSAPAAVTPTRSAPLFSDTSAFHIVPSTPSHLPSGLSEMHNEATAPAALSSTLPSSDDNGLRNQFGDHATTDHSAFSPFAALRPPLWQTMWTRTPSTTTR